MSDELKQEIELIQSCINRMSQNSFNIKCWTITITAGFIALAAERIDVVVIVGLLIVFFILFWYLDTYYL